MPSLALLRRKPLLAAPAAWLVALASAHAQNPDSFVSPVAHELFNIGGIFPVTNAMVTTWFFSLVIVLLIRWAVGRPKLIPSRGQTVVETMLESLREIMELIVGPHMIKQTFPLLISLFMFILIMNWSGLLPGVGTFGLMEKEPDGHPTLLYFFRPANSDLNTTLALALIYFVAWIYFVLRYAGIKTLLYDIFGNKADRKDVHIALYLALCPLFFVVGFVEIISIMSRLLSLPFRLYGNVFGGENLLNSIYNIFPFVMPVPFIGLEMLVGLVQAFVFTVLVAVYIGLICNHDSGEGHGADAHESH